MTRLFLIPVAICLIITAAPSISAAQTETDGVRPGGQTVEPQAGSSPLAAPLFQLETLPDDSPNLAVKKAALRLFNAYSLTVKRLTTCKATMPEAGKVLGTFNNRNGNTLGLVMKVVKGLGGVTPEIKQVMDQETDRRLASEPVDCQALVKAVNNGERDIYKAPEFVDDYKLIQTMK